ncbi:hypothetical protein Syun_013774 [Stephania yunnanensis]|uniref:Alginate lyase 2 domain-containing protein n=1 Tax=Stephania yunnanensis TaxID=152371 RepID=A0AAP0JI94_9MAGN
MVISLQLVGFYGAKGQVESGFSQVSLASSDLQIQKPYDVPQSARYSFINGVHKLWVYSTDKPHAPSSSTKPRNSKTYAKIFHDHQNHDYSSGTWQFEAYGYVPSGTTGVSIMQIFGGSPQATTLMLRVYNGALQYYQAQGHNYSSGVWQFEGYGYVPRGTSGVCIMQIFGASGNHHATTLMLRVYNGALRYYSTDLVLDPNIYNKWFRLNVIHHVEAKKLWFSLMEFTSYM